MNVVPKPVVPAPPVGGAQPVAVPMGAGPVLSDPAMPVDPVHRHGNPKGVYTPPIHR